MSENEQGTESKGQFLNIVTLNTWLVRIIFILFTAGISYSIAVDTEQDNEIKQLNARMTETESVSVYEMEKVVDEKIYPRLDNIERCLIRISNNGSCQDFE